MLLLAVLVACSDPAPPAPPAAPVPPAPPSPAIALAHRRDPVELVVAPSTRPAPLPEAFPPAAPWTVHDEAGPLTIWSTPLPVDFHLFLQRQAGARTFGFYAPEGLEVAVGGRPLAFLRKAKDPWTWGYDPDRLYVGLPAREGPPADVVLRWPKATAAERAQHLDTSGLSPLDFAFRGVAQGVTSHAGLLLPAPARVAWRVEVPNGAVLAARAWILPPAIRTAEASDGATLRVEHVPTTGGGPTELVSLALGAEPVDVRVPVPAGGGTIRLVVDPGATAVHDLVFVEDPTIHVPRSDPRRVVLAFVDTVRADHLGMYGYTRPTTPKLDAWARGAARFDAARTVSPWTLPSALATLSGRQPEAWSAGANLAELASAAGVRTEAIVANAYLSQVFGVHRGFSHYRYRILQPAAQTVDQAIEVLERWPDRDVLLLVQFMEAHLPYDEPPAYRSLFAGDKPPQLPAITRNDLVRWSGDEPDFAAIRDHVVGRYDNNLRVLDDEVSRLFEAAGDHATTVLFADHGEEFWDHGGFEHGHTFHEELLRVPLVVRGPAVQHGAVAAPVSLLDVTPTVLDVLGLPVPDGLAGRSLRPVAAGDAAATAALASRAQAFGRPLYGDDGWGVVLAGQKWVARGPAESVWDLAADPGEATNVAATTDRARFAPALAEALGREVVEAWRVVVRNERLRGDARVRLTHPAGLALAWSAYDPKGWFEDVVPQVSDGAVALTRPAGRKAPPAFFVRVPAGADPAALVVTVEAGEVRTLAGTAPGPDDGSARVVVADPAGAVRVELVRVPVPGGEAVRASNAEVGDALKVLGYQE